ncbi:hypothetical protein BC937DRAFT_86425 [Endogone sp. FLAS-F59071]|nr:hypothetical protein BC937DRAFT_86425 [Endogone sp. FLAS-F59071]|eukprot:RUS22841.1 hypothetical protein BC937DRAFT_86425 [Endogone sp. FLAS-F59071]
MLADHDERAVYFHRLAAEDPSLLYSPFLKCLDMNDDYIPLQASKILTILICSSPSAVDVTEFFKWITQQFSAQNPNVVDLAVQALESLLRIRPYRRVFWDTPHAVDSLVKILKRNTPTLQMQYQVIFCLWLLAFESEIAAQLNRKYDIIPILIETAKAAIKEKVIRVVIATFRNLVEKAPEANLAAMLVAKLLPFCENLATRKWTDSEILEDVVYLRQELQDNFQSLTTFEEYASEVQTGKLEWSPPHGSETFWKQNAARLNENDAELLRILSRLLSTSQDPIVLAVAAHDIGQYIKFGPKDAKKLVQEIGAKQRVMELMTHADPDVRYQALLAVQKYMVNAWEF